MACDRCGIHDRRRCQRHGSPKTLSAACEDVLPRLPGVSNRVPARPLDHRLSLAWGFMDMRLEVVPVPVRDVDAAKDFYIRQVGFRLDHDVTPSPDMRVVQMTPPGSACSVVIGEGLPLGEPGSVKGVQLVVEDLERCPQRTRRARGCHQRRAADGARGHARLTLLLLPGPRREHVGGPGVQARVADGRRLRAGLTRPPLAVHHASCGRSGRSCGGRGRPCRRSRLKLAHIWPAGGFVRVGGGGHLAEGPGGGEGVRARPDQWQANSVPA